MPMEQLKTGDKINMFRDRSPDAIALDNLIRKTLRVSDPANATEMAKALRNYYPTDKEFMAREAAGMPFVSAPVQAAAPQAATSTSAEVEQAVSDVERDLAGLTQNATLKDIEPELQGWATAVRGAIADGIHAARFALDPRQRDRAFAVRRLLGNYARVARYVGALTPSMSRPFRSFAQSLDEVAGIVLVLAGESLANNGIGGGKFILQAPVSEIQTRRDAVIYALRNLVGSAQQSYGPNEWPRGLQAYQQFLERLGNNAQHDLRALFQESELAKMMDDLIHLATGNTSSGNRALGSTALLSLERVNRLILFGQGLVDPESPPLASFLMSLKLFIEAFENGGRGSRLLTIARPPLLFYGLYGMKQDDASKRLLNLIIERGNLAEELDCYKNCSCAQEEVDCLISLDKVLYDIDRAIDLYALGVDDFGEPEQRAAAYGYIIQAANKQPCVTANSSLMKTLTSIQKELWFYTFTEDDFAGLDDTVLTCAGIDDGFEAKFFLDPPESLAHKLKLFEKWKNNDQPDGGIYSCFKNHLMATGDIHDRDEEIPVAMLPESIRKLENMLKVIHQELCAQSAMEQNWEILVRSMAPSCFRRTGNGENPVKEIITKALKDFSCNAACMPFDVDIPPHFETSLAGITYSRFSEGGRS
jgi:hypothetical protein